MRRSSYLVGYGVAVELPSAAARQSGCWISIGQVWHYQSLGPGKKFKWNVNKLLCPSVENSLRFFRFHALPMEAQL